MNINENTLPAQYRDINIVTAEIRTITITVKKIMLATAIELGRRLVEAKEMLPHGEWGDWLKREVDFSQSTANNLMKIYREYGSAQESLFGEANSQMFENLTYSQAILLLKVPEDEREEFVQANDVENLSTKELEQAIKAKQEAEKQAASAAESLKKAEEAAAEAEQTAKSAEQRAAKAESEKEKAVNALEEEMKAKAKVKAELDNLKANPEIPAETLEKISSEALDKAAAEYERKLEKAQRVAEGAAEQARVLRKELAVANPEVAAFNVYFKQLQEDLGKLSSSLAKIRGMNPETADKLTAGAKGVIEQLISNL